MKTLRVKHEARASAKCQNVTGYTAEQKLTLLRLFFKFPNSIQYLTITARVSTQIRTSVNIIHFLSGSNLINAQNESKLLKNLN